MVRLPSTGKFLLGYVSGTHGYAIRPEGTHYFARAGITGRAGEIHIKTTQEALIMILQQIDFHNVAEAEPFEGG